MLDSIRHLALAIGAALTISQPATTLVSQESSVAAVQVDDGRGFLVLSGVPHVVCGPGHTAASASGFARIRLSRAGSLRLESATRRGRNQPVRAGGVVSEVDEVNAALLDELARLDHSTRMALLWELQPSAVDHEQTGTAPVEPDLISVRRFVFAMALDDRLMLLGSDGLVQSFDVKGGRFVGYSVKDIRWGIYVIDCEGVLQLLRPTAAVRDVDAGLLGRDPWSWSVCSLVRSDEVIKSRVLGAAVVADATDWLAQVVHAAHVEGAGVSLDEGHLTRVRFEDGACRVAGTASFRWDTGELVLHSEADMQELEVAYWSDPAVGELLALGLPSWMQREGRVELRARNVGAREWRALQPFAEAWRLNYADVTARCCLGRALGFVAGLRAHSWPDLVVAAPDCGWDSVLFRLSLDPLSVFWFRPLQDLKHFDPLDSGGALLVHNGQGEAGAMLECANASYLPRGSAEQAAVHSTFAPSTLYHAGSGLRVERVAERD